MDPVEYEQYALVQYLVNNNPGPVIKQLMEERITALEFIKNNCTEPEKKIRGINRVKCIHKASGTVYSSIAEAAEDLEINHTTLIKDMWKRNFKHGVYPL